MGVGERDGDRLTSRCRPTSLRSRPGSWRRTCSRFDEWLTIFGGWRSEVPDAVEVGTCVSSCIKVKGFRNIIHWRVTRYDEPKVIELVGRGAAASASR